MGSSFFQLEALDATPLVREPFEYVIVPNFIGPAALARLNGDYPKVTQRGSFPVNVVPYGPAFQELLDELEGSIRMTNGRRKAAGCGSCAPVPTSTITSPRCRRSAEPCWRFGARTTPGTVTNPLWVTARSSSSTG